MSGGHFDYIQYRFDDVASSIEQQIAANEYEPAIVNRFQLAADTVRLAGKMIQRVDWLVSDDDGPDSFLTRWHDEGLPVPEAATTRAARAASYGALRQSSLTAVAMDCAAVELAALESELGERVQELAAANALIHQLGENAAKAAGEYAERVAVLERALCEALDALKFQPYRNTRTLQAIPRVEAALTEQPK